MDTGRGIYNMKSLQERSNNVRFERQCSQSWIWWWEDRHTWFLSSHFYGIYGCCRFVVSRNWSQIEAKQGRIKVMGGFWEELVWSENFTRLKDTQGMKDCMEYLRLCIAYFRKCDHYHITWYNITRCLGWLWDENVRTRKLISMIHNER